MGDTLRRHVFPLLDAMHLLTPVRKFVRPLLPSWRARQRAANEAFAAFLGGVHPRRDFALDDYPATENALVVGYDTPALATFQTPLLLALRMAGYRISVVLGSESSASAGFYFKIGADQIVATEALPADVTHAESAELLRHVRTSAELLELKEAGVSVGKFAVSTLMRRRRTGSVDPIAVEGHDDLVNALTESRCAARHAKTIVDRLRPRLVCFYDRGYTPDGELFEVALASGARATTLNSAHKSGSVISKCYGPHNRDVHFGMPSPELWQALREMPWTSTHWNRLRSELEGCYVSGVWYDEVGTQANKTAVGKADLIVRLGLSPDKPTAVIFPHLFWDATFFWGSDLFADYEEWFVEAVKAAVANPALNWIVKVHPANMVKNRRDNFSGDFSEIEAIRKAVGELPSHVTVIMPDSPISTFSLFDLMDYCLTVRGTVGLEAAIFGKQVLTAGTGRYDGFGFTIDSSSRQEYLKRLRNLQSIVPPTPAQTELARRYAYGLFMLRPLETGSMQFRYANDAFATLTTTLGLTVGQRLEDMPDLRRLANWFQKLEADDLIGSSEWPD